MFSASLSGGWDFGSARASGVSASSPVVAAPAATPRTINDFTASAAGDVRRTLAADVIVAAAPDPVFVSDLRGKILEANEVVSQLLGLRRDEVPHMAWQSRRGAAHGRGAVLSGPDRLLQNLTQLPVAGDPRTRPPRAVRVHSAPGSRSYSGIAGSFQRMTKYW